MGHCSKISRKIKLFSVYTTTSSRTINTWTKFPKQTDKQNYSGLFWVEHELASLHWYNWTKSTQMSLSHLYRNLFNFVITAFCLMALLGTDRGKKVHGKLFEINSILWLLRNLCTETADVHGVSWVRPRETERQRDRDGERERERERKYLPYFKRTKRPKWQDGSENKNSCESLILFCRGQYWTKNNKTISKRADNTQHTHTKNNRRPLLLSVMTLMTN